MIEGEWLSNGFLVGMEFRFNKFGYIKVGVVQEAIDDSVDLPMGQFASSLNQLGLLSRISKARNLDCVLGRQLAQFTEQLRSKAENTELGLAL
jgi:hypothetical protein